MKLVTFEDIKRLNIAPAKCYEWVSEMITVKKTALLPPKISLKPFGGVFCNVMPSMIDVNGKMYGGVKIVTRYPDRKPSLDSKLLLFDVETGEYLAFMDADYITAMRTGAVAVHSIKLFAKSDFSTIGVMGLGNTARATFLVLSEIMPDINLKVKLLKFNGQEELFIRRFADMKSLKFSSVDTAEEMVRGSDVVISAATYLPNDICSDDCYDNGVLVVPIHTLGFTNCDLFFDKIFADDYGHVCHFKNFNKFKKFAEVCEVVNGEVRGRENDDERILVYNIGISVHDINFAARIYNILKDDNSLPNINFFNPTDKFWI